MRLRLESVRESTFNGLWPSLVELSGPSLSASAFAAFVRKYLLRSLPPGAPSARAVTETQYPAEGDDWFWTDDNAKVLELLSLPEVWRENPEDVADILRFVIGMCEGPFIFRRLAGSRLQQVSRDGGAARFVHSLMNISCDLARGSVGLGMRFHDGRTASNVLMTGNYVSFLYRGRSYVVDVEDAISGYDVALDADRLILSWQSELSFRQGLLRTVHRLGRLVYTVAVRANSMFVDVEAALDLDPEITVEDVVLTFGYDNLSHGTNEVRYETIRAAHPVKPAQCRGPGERSGLHMAVEGCNYWSIAQTSQISGFALAVHSLPQPGSPLHSLNATCSPEDRLHWVVAEHRFAGPQSGRLVAGERKVITAGGFYDLADIYATTLAGLAARGDTGAPAIDPSISYDYGAELLAFTRCYCALTAKNPPVDDATLCCLLRDRIDHFCDVYQTHFMTPFRANASAIFSRSVAFMALALADMVELTGEPRYVAPLRDACEIILSFECRNRDVAGQPQSAFVMGREAGSLPYVDCHSSCLLALVRATDVLDDGQWLASIDLGLRAYRVDTQAIEFDRTLHKQDVVAVDYLATDGTRHAMPAFWNYQIGITLRMLNALRASRRDDLRAVWQLHAPRFTTLEWMLRHRVEQCLRRREDATEIRTSVLSSETNSETQPWVAVALLNADPRAS